MDELRFDGRTAIVTGAGGNPSLGRAHAMLLASRGANVVVNDIGGDVGMKNMPGMASAEVVVEEIKAAGGNAVADTHSVADVAGAEAIIQTALDAFGSLDILVNNAGISIGADVDEMSPEDYRRHIDVNLMGTIWCARAAWPHMKKAGYGRIVNITSGSMAGFERQAAYAASKGGAWSFTRTLASEGSKFGVKANAVSPGAFTRLVSSTLEDDSPLLAHSRDNLPAELSSPAVAFLAHESCPVTGECIDSVGGVVQRTFMARTTGITDPDITIEKIARNWDTIMNRDGYEVVPHGEMDTSEWGFREYEPDA